MSEGSGRTQEDSRFDLLEMLRELEAEAANQIQGPIKQDDIQKLFESRKRRESDR